MANRTEFQTPNLALQNIKLTSNLEAQETFDIWKNFTAGGKG